MNINRTLQLPANQYHALKAQKTLIGLHHTVGGSAKSTFDYWVSDPVRVGTAYLVERDGTVYEVFPPEYYACGFGVKGQYQLEPRSIQIEICSEGPLRKCNDSYYMFDRVSESTKFKGQVCTLATPWRNQKYFAAYTDAQTKAVIELVGTLAQQFGIPLCTPKDRLNFSENNYTFQGIIGHHHVRPDKTDVHPGFDWDEMIKTLGIREL